MHRLRHLLLVTAAVLACAAPERGRPRIIYPYWQITLNKRFTVGCSDVAPWVSRSGKTGLGVTLQLNATGSEPCPVRVAEAFVLLEDETIPVAQAPAEAAASSTGTRVYLPFPFDNEAAWNRGARRGELLLRVVAGEVRRELRLPIVHVYQSMLSTPTSPRPPDLSVDPITPDKVRLLQPGRGLRGLPKPAPLEEMTSTSTAESTSTSTDVAAGDASTAPETAPAVAP